MSRLKAFFQNIQLLASLNYTNIVYNTKFGVFFDLVHMHLFDLIKL